MPLHSPACFVTTSLRDLMAFIGSWDLLICNDSGPMHIAYALGFPVVAVFTTGNPKSYGPSGKHQKVVGEGSRRGSTADISVRSVLAAAEEQLERAIKACSRVYGIAERNLR